MAKDTTVRNQFKDSEICAAKTINNVYTRRIRVDSSFYDAFLFYGSNASSFIQIKSKLRTFGLDYNASSTPEEKGAMIILRKCTLKEPVNVGSKLFAVSIAQLLPKEFFDRFESVDYNLIYNNGELLGYKVGKIK